MCARRMGMAVTGVFLAAMTACTPSGPAPGGAASEPARPAETSGAAPDTGAESVAPAGDFVDCNDIESTLVAAASGFAGVTGNAIPELDSDFQSYSRSTLVMTGASNCQISAGDSGESALECDWGRPNEPAGRETHGRLVEVIETCLPDWTATNLEGAGWLPAARLWRGPPPHSDWIIAATLQTDSDEPDGAARVYYRLSDTVTLCEQIAALLPAAALAINTPAAAGEPLEKPGWESFVGPVDICQPNGTGGAYTTCGYIVEKDWAREKARLDACLPGWTRSAAPPGSFLSDVDLEDGVTFTGVQDGTGMQVSVYGEKGPWPHRWWLRATRP